MTQVATAGWRTIPDDGILDEIAVERAMRGDRVVLTTCERAEAARRLALAGASRAEIGAVLHMSGSRVAEVLGGQLLRHLASESDEAGVS